VKSPFFSVFGSVTHRRTTSSLPDIEQPERTSENPRIAMLVTVFPYISLEKLWKSGSVFSSIASFNSFAIQEYDQPK